MPLGRAASLLITCCCYSWRLLRYQPLYQFCLWLSFRLPGVQHGIQSVSSYFCERSFDCWLVWKATDTILHRHLWIYELYAHMIDYRAIDAHWIPFLLFNQQCENIWRELTALTRTKGNHLLTSVFDINSSWSTKYLLTEGMPHSLHRLSDATVKASKLHYMMEIWTLVLICCHHRCHGDACCRRSVSHSCSLTLLYSDRIFMRLSLSTHCIVSTPRCVHVSYWLASVSSFHCFDTVGSLTQLSWGFMPPLNTKWLISEMFFPANLLAWYWRN